MAESCIIQKAAGHGIAAVADLNFRYRDPEAGFDRDKVKGVVAKLVHIQDVSNATALEVAAGGKLYQVIVDTEATAKALLARGHLRNRVTIIPINKVSPSFKIIADCVLR